jgi:hypothetical protein
MALPFILSLLGSTAAGTGLLSGLGLSPLIGGALGAGVGSAIETGDLGKGITTGLTAGLLGGVGGALVGGGAGAAGAAATQGAATGQTLGQTVGSTTGQQVATQAATQGGGGIFGNLFQNMQPGLTAGTAAPASTPISQVLTRGFQEGALTGAGLGTAAAGMMASQPPTMDMPGMDTGQRERRRMTPREYLGAAPADYRPGTDPEYLYFSPQIPTYAGGGMVSYRPTGMQEPVRMQAGGIADMGGMPEMSREMNDKDIVREAIRAVRGEMPEQQAAVVLGQFLQTFGEGALRRLVDDVRQGRADGPRGDVEGEVRGAGDGMDDLVPARMDDDSQDVLLSDGEFIVPADVVSGLGNGSTDAGAEELHRMMDRVRGARTGTTEQPAQVAVGGLLPA